MKWYLCIIIYTLVSSSKLTRIYWRYNEIIFIIAIFHILLARLILRLESQLKVIDEHSHEQVKKHEILDHNVDQKEQHYVPFARVLIGDVLVDFVPIIEREELEKREKGREEVAEANRVDVGIQTTTDDGKHVHEERNQQDDSSDGPDGLQDCGHDHLKVRKKPAR